MHWTSWRVASRQVALLDWQIPVADEYATAGFVAHKGSVMGYAYNSVHVMLYAMRHITTMERQNGPMLATALKDLKRICGGPWSKIAATPEPLMLLAEDLNSGDCDGPSLALAVSVVFVFLLRSREALTRVWPRSRNTVC